MILTTKINQIPSIPTRFPSNAPKLPTILTKIRGIIKDLDRKTNFLFNLLIYAKVRIWRHCIKACLCKFRLKPLIFPTVDWGEKVKVDGLMEDVRCERGWEAWRSNTTESCRSLGSLLSIRWHEKRRWNSAGSIEKSKEKRPNANFILKCSINWQIYTTNRVTKWYKHSSQIRLGSKKNIRPSFHLWVIKIKFCGLISEEERCAFFVTLRSAYCVNSSFNAHIVIFWRPKPVFLVVQLNSQIISWIKLICVMVQ